MSNKNFQLRTFCYIDRMQPQFAAFLGATVLGDPPVDGMSSLFVEMAPGNTVFRVVDRVVKVANVRPGRQVVERHYGMFEVHSDSQAEVLRAGEVVLEVLGLPAEARVAPTIASQQVITNVNPYQAQLLNRNNLGTMLVAGQALLVMEVTPAAYITFATNEAEKAATVYLNHMSAVGAFGRLWMSGTEANIRAAHEAAVNALKTIEGIVV